MGVPKASHETSIWLDAIEKAREQCADRIEEMWPYIVKYLAESDEVAARVAQAIEDEADRFRDPVSFYVTGEARERWERDNPNKGIDDTPVLDWELESWKILARAALNALR